MTFIVEKDEGTAGRRFVPFHLFASTGTGPFTGGSNITMLGSLNGAAQISLGSVSVVSANAGQYGFQLTASNCSTLGSLALYTDNVAHFPQHVATVQVVNYNPMSLQSGVIIAGGSYSSTTVRLDLVAYSGATVGAGNFAPGVYSGVSFSVRDSGIANSSFQAGTFSNVTVQGVINVDSGVSIRAGTHSSVTIQGLSNYANISNVTLAAGTHSNVTIQGISNYANISNVTLAAGTHSNVTIQGLSNYANISNVTLAVGNHSGATVDGVRFLATAGERSLASSILSSPMGNNRILQEYIWPLRNRVQISGSTGTVFLPDDATSSWTFSATTAAFPLSGIDPGGT